MTKEQVDACTILRGVAGSRMLGLDTPESDVDILGICIEPMVEAMGVGAPFEQWVDERAQTQIYGLRKFLRLALKGNPSMLALLFMNNASGLQVRDARGAQLQELAPAIVSRRASGPFLGYIQAQRDRLMGRKSHGGHGPLRQDLIEKYGFDTKYAMHMLRLGIQGVELLKTGRLTLPMHDKDREFLRGVRSGLSDLDHLLNITKDLEAELQDLFHTSKLQDRPQVAEVERWMVNMYFRNWSATRRMEDMMEDLKLTLASIRDEAKVKK